MISTHASFCKGMQHTTTCAHAQCPPCMHARGTQVMRSNHMLQLMPRCARATAVSQPKGMRRYLQRVHVQPSATETHTACPQCTLAALGKGHQCCHFKPANPARALRHCQGRLSNTSHDGDRQASCKQHGLLPEHKLIVPGRHTLPQQTGPSARSAQHKLTTATA